MPATSFRIMSRSSPPYRRSAHLSEHRLLATAATVSGSDSALYSRLSFMLSRWPAFLSSPISSTFLPARLARKEPPERHESVGLCAYRRLARRRVQHHSGT